MAYGQSWKVRHWFYGSSGRLNPVGRYIEYTGRKSILGSQEEEDYIWGVPQGMPSLL